MNANLTQREVTILSCRIHGEEDTLFAFKGRIDEDLLVDHAQKFYVDERYENPKDADYNLFSKTDFMIGDKPLADFQFNTMNELEEAMGYDDCFVSVKHLVVTHLVTEEKS